MHDACMHMNFISVLQASMNFNDKNLENSVNSKMKSGALNYNTTGLFELLN